MGRVSRERMAAERSTEGAAAGLLVVGLGGNNGVTLLAGWLANRQGLEWESAAGRMQANYLGCISQLPERGGALGYRQRYGLAHANDLAVGGWDIRSTPLGDALYESRVLEYDLVRQVREEMNAMEILPGVWDASYIGETQHATATHTVELASHLERLDHLRADIRRFRETHKIRGHTTVIWSASVERPRGDPELETAQQLMDAIERNDVDLVSPSLLYATAAVLEGCSFVNGGSQNTLCPALVSLARAQGGVYVLGTDFKAGQTKFKTAAVEYVRKLGLRPKVIASSNHLGNNDMRNLTSRATQKAKMRVKRNIFESWEEDIDHQVCVMFTPLIGDEKRDVVEYTSWGFLGCAHTMVTYTRCMDSILCVPLMIDVAVWLDFFAQRSHKAPVSHARVARATAYLFKVPEGEALGVDPGFFHQMGELERVLAEAAHSSSSASSSSSCGASAGVDQARGGAKAPIFCLGFACLDLELLGAAQCGEADAINAFARTAYRPGGSVCQVSCALAKQRREAVFAVARLGRDAHGDELARLLDARGVDTSLLLRGSDTSGTSCGEERKQGGADDAAVATDTHETSLSVLPVFAGTGDRACFVNIGANRALSGADVVGQVARCLATSTASSRADGVMWSHFGYPHLLPQLQGENLRSMFQELRAMAENMVVSCDTNGATGAGAMLAAGTSESTPPAAHLAVEAALPLVDVFHANLAEAEAMTGLSRNAADEESTPAFARRLCEWFLQHGVVLAIVTAGAEGAAAATTIDVAALQRCPLVRGELLPQLAPGQQVFVRPEPIPPATPMNANGAGDAFMAGFIHACLDGGGNDREEGDDREESGLAAAVAHATRVARDHLLSV